MRLKASFTVENSVIIPLFTIIVVLMIRMTFYLHDEVVLRNAEFQAAIMLEQEEMGLTELQRKNIIQNTSDYIKLKSLLNIADRLSVEQDLSQKEIIKSNSQPDFIRITNAGLKLKEVGYD